MVRPFMVLLTLSAFVAACAQMPAQPDIKTARQQVFTAERAFAKSMADRSLKDFSMFVSEEAVFFGGAKSLRGRDAVVAAWQRFFEGDTAPFSWAPETVEVVTEVVRQEMPVFLSSAPQSGATSPAALAEQVVAAALELPAALNLATKSWAGRE